MLADIIISLFTVFIYTALGIYFLTKNPQERTNRLFALLMLAFIMWSVAAYGTGAKDSADTSLYLKIELIGVILALTIFTYFSILLIKGKTVKKPFVFLIFFPSIYIMHLIWTSPMEQSIFIANAGTKKEFFLFSTVFGVAGVYLLLRHYMTGKYRQREQARLILSGAIVATIAAITANILLPMLFNVYFSGLSTLPPAVMGIFFAYAIYQYGLSIRPMPEVSVTSFCGTECTVCPEYIEKRCAGCKLSREMYRNCEAYLCAAGKEYAGCGDCPEIITCQKRKTKQVCFSGKPEHELNPGQIYFSKGDGYDMFLDAVRIGALGVVVTASHPEQLRGKYDLNTTPIIWLSDDAFDEGVRPDDLERLGVVLINYMKKIENAGTGIILFDGIGMLIGVNGIDKVLGFIKILNRTLKLTNSSLIIPDAGGRLGQEIEHQEI